MRVGHSVPWGRAISRRDAVWAVQRLCSPPGGPLNPRVALVIVVVLVVVAGLYVWWPDAEAPGQRTVATEPSPVVRSRTAKAGKPPPVLPDLEEVPEGETTDALHTLAYHARRTLIACPVPDWIDDPRLVRPAWIEGGMLYDLVGTAPSQRVLYRAPTFELSYTLDEVRAAADDPEVRDAILAEAAEKDPKARPMEPVGVLRWEAAEPGEVARCTVHDVDDLVTLVVYGQDETGALTPAFVKAGEQGRRADEGIAELPVVAGAEVRVSARGDAGSSSMRTVPSEGSEVVLTLGNADLPSPMPVDWRVANAQAAGEVDAAGKATLLAYEAHLSGGSGPDPMRQALRELADPIAAATKKTSDGGGPGSGVTKAPQVRELPR